MNLVNCRNVVKLYYLFSQSFWIEKPGIAILETLQLYMSWSNENQLKQGNQSYEGRYKENEIDLLCSIKKHESYLAIDSEELQNFNFVQSVEDEDNEEFFNHKSWLAWSRFGW